MKTILTLLIFGIFEAVIYIMFGDIFHEWVWWFGLSPSAPEKQDVAINVIAIIKILFGLGFLVLLPFVGAGSLSDKILNRIKQKS